MSFLKWFKPRRKNLSELKNQREDFDEDNDGRPEENEETEKYTGRDIEEDAQSDGAKLVYFACQAPHENIINVLRSITNSLETFTVEKECIDYITPITQKTFLVIDGSPPATFMEAIEQLKQIDSIFFYSTPPGFIPEITKTQHSYLVNSCDSENALIDSIKKSREELDKQTTAFSMYNKKEKATRDLSKESGSFLFFQLFKIVLKSMPKSAGAKKTMVTTCRNYYRGNITELKNIDDFDRTYKSDEAIPWYTKETFVYKFINKALRTEDVDVLYQFRFYIMDLSEQLERKFKTLQEKQKDILRLYRGSKLSQDEVENFQRSIGNLISTNGYLSTSDDRTVAYGFATKSARREGFVRALFEYRVDLEEVKKIVIADIREFSAFPEEAEVLVDIGASFQIDSCQYSADEDLWHIQVHATDQGAELAAEYMEYQKKKMVESNIVLMLGNLLLEMGEYTKAERYFDTILHSEKPNDEEIACIFFNFGRTHRLKGDFNRAIKCYNRAYNLHVDARPKRLASAGKTLNGLGVVYSEQGRQIKARECFEHALKLYKTSIPKKHVDVAGTLINLGTIDCDQQDYYRALTRFLKAKKIYDISLPPGHPNHAIPRVNLGNVYLATEDYLKACEEYESALKLQESSLPSDHPDIARTLHNLAVVQTHLGNMELAKQYLERAEETATHTLTSTHPVMSLLTKTKAVMAEEIEGYIYTRH
ncbi:unnamed protein product [Rotaria sp. Silwood2]|nr:unnamed protein product [Rotaria sp. Silwood2]CAF2482448.1 unnamed protein product [Rotaria sp. Silwood2]CAF4159420.1 unnamed protein product [Rotaria sp. Silwood2]CAF4388035.1 unnamed protein product [Rotaria sp. Silwood2]